MTIDGARYSARLEATRTGKLTAVYRFSAWRAEVFGVRAVEQLPPDAVIVATYAPDREVFDVAATRPATPAGKQPPAEQGSLF